MGKETDEETIISKTTIEQAKQKLLNNIDGNDLTDKFALAYKYLCEAELLEDELAFHRSGESKATEEFQKWMKAQKGSGVPQD